MSAKLEKSVYCKCGRLIGVMIGNRMIIGDCIAPIFIGGCRGCKSLFVWLWGKGWEIKRI